MVYSGSGGAYQPRYVEGFPDTVYINIQKILKIQEKRKGGRGCHQYNL